MKPTDNCVDVPKEVCVRVRTNPRKIKRPVIKKWCYVPSEESGLDSGLKSSSGSGSGLDSNVERSARSNIGLTTSLPTNEEQVEVSTIEPGLEVAFTEETPLED